MRQITKRLLPDQDLKKEIEKLTRLNKIKAGVVVSIVGGLKEAVLRMAGGKKIKSLSGPFEIVGGTGTVSKNGCHIHITIADSNGRAIGGHLKEGCIVKFTVEIVFLVFPESEYQRKFDKKTGYRELIVK